MTRAGSFDGEIGRGRQRDGEDSSSSRESSPVPRRAPNRSFSPPSDDGDVVIQNEGKDQPPPPAERPIIRQAVAFSEQASQVPVMTYEAKVLQPKKNHFLPGQEVPLPPKQKATRRNNGVKRPRRPDAYPGQTSRFRLETYDPTPTSQPPTTHGNGPYSSLYRDVGTAARSKSARTSLHLEPQAGSSNSVSTSGLTSLSNSGSYPNNSSAYLAPSGSNDASKTTYPMQLSNPVSPTEFQQIPTINHSTSSSLISHSHHQAQTVPSPPPRPSSADNHPHSTFLTTSTLTIREHNSPSPYYRRNYDDKDLTLSLDPRSISRSTSAKSSLSDTYSLGLTLVTLLITDLRSELGEADHQLAEVRVSLKKSDVSEEGWWADAKDIAEQLQAGAARIDGPARVYTMRGKYRQFILRVTAGNMDEIVSANVPVSADRTVNLIVEMLNPPGVPTRPQPNSRRKLSRTYDSRFRRSEEQMYSDLNRAAPRSRKRRASPSFDDYDDHSDHHFITRLPKVPRRDRGWDWSPRRRSPTPRGDGPLYTSRTNQEIRSWRNSSSLDRGQHRHSRSPEYHSHGSPSPPPLAPTPLPPVHVGPGYPRREEDGDSHDLPNEPFIGAVERFLREDLEGSDEYFKAIANNRVCDIVKQYEIVSKMFKKWVGKPPPGFPQPIEEIHIVKALEIEDPHEFVSNCNETLTLLKLYGKRGRVIEDPRVISMLDDQKHNPANSDPAQKLLRLLRALHDAWKNNRSGPLLNGIMPPEASDLFKKPDYGPEAKSEVSGHRQTTPASAQQYSHHHSSPSKSEPGLDTRYSSRGKTMFVD